MPEFKLHPALAASSVFVCDLDLSQVRLQDDARFPWLVLVPRVPDVRELDDLTPQERAVMIEEIAQASGVVRALGEADGRPVEKLNVGALGNVTPQLHVHVLGRRSDDGLWPDPVWGRGEARPYPPAHVPRLAATARWVGIARLLLGQGFTGLYGPGPHDP
jgi:diadenosine tetraphosphate (Ap4A) HIT family hydrolase